MDDAELRKAIELLELLGGDLARLALLDDELRRRLVVAAGQISRPDRYTRAALSKAAVRARKVARRDAAVAALDQTGIRALRREPVYRTPLPPPEVPLDEPPRGDEPGEPDAWAAAEARRDQPPVRRLADDRHCYVCKADFRELHHFYDQLCPACAAFNFAKRTESADLRGRVALLTGGRVKIGYQAGIKLLRAGAALIVTTRFPRDSALRYAREPDFEEWGDRLEIFGLDLRHTPSVEAFCRHLLTTRTRLDFIVNNACQTVRRPPEFYRHMMELETASLGSMPDAARGLLGEYEGLRGYDLVGEGTPALLEVGASDPVGLTHAAELSQARLLPDDDRPAGHLFPEGQLDQDLQQVDLRGRNSWRLTLEEVSSVELLETQLVNAVAPFVLNGKLKPLMTRTPERDKHIVNVSAVEGQFYRRFKTTKHPHTNMAKAALNMMTRTSAADYHHDGIHMNSVDTGWVSDEDPVHIAERKTAEHRFHPPLDIVDGAARIVDPIFAGLATGEHAFGKFFKDYRVVDW